MQAFSAVVLQRDPHVAQSMAAWLHDHFRSVVVTQSERELREMIAKKRPEVVILDIETWRLPEVQSLHQAFPRLSIVCTHRVPDEEMWAAALDAGASDVCPSSDVQAILNSALRHAVGMRSAAA